MARRFQGSKEIFGSAGKHRDMDTKIFDKEDYAGFTPMETVASRNRRNHVKVAAKVSCAVRLNSSGEAHQAAATMRSSAWR